MSAYPQLVTARRASIPADLMGPALFLVAAAGAVGVFWFGLFSLGGAWARPEYSHGPVIPLLSAYMMLVELRRAPGGTPRRRDGLPGVLVVTLAVAVGTTGYLVRIPDVVSYGFILWVWGMVMVVMGPRRSWVVFPSVLHLAFMLPLPQFVYWHFSTWLQHVSSEIGVVVISWFGVPAYLDGNIIDLGIYKLQVAEACSGLRYLFPVMSFSYVFGVLYTGPRWHSLVLFAAAAPLTLLMNSLRIGVIGVLVDRYGISQAEGFLHAFEGWIFFAACIACLFACSILLQLTTGKPRPISRVLDLDFDGVLPQARRFLDIRPTPALLLAGAVTCATALALPAVPDGGRVTPERTPLALFPADLGAWQADSMQRLARDAERVLKADDYHLASYRSAGAAKPVDLFIAFYDRQIEGRGIHSPEVCIPSGGWEVSEWARADLVVSGRDGSTVRLPANRAVIQKGLDRQLVLYWYEQRGRRMTNAYAVKAVTFWDAVFTGRTDGALVRLITPLAAGESPAQAEARLADFIGSFVSELPQFLPE